MNIGWDREQGDGWSLIGVHFRVLRWTFQVTFDLSRS